MFKWFAFLIIVAVTSKIHAKTSDLEKFLTSGFDKDSNDENQDKQSPEKITENSLVQFMRRAGLISSSQDSNQQAVLQSLNPKANIYYVPQASQLTNYVAPKRQMEVPQQQLQNQQLQEQIQKLKQKIQQHQQKIQQQQPLPLASTSVNKIATNQDYVTATPQASSDTKTIGKEDRQGFYAQDEDLYNDGYANNNGGGHIDAVNGYSDNHAGGYSAGHNYLPEPVYYKPPVYHPPSVAIKIDPLNILRILLQGIPKPILNLNGRLFFGVELGKKAGLVKGIGAQPHVGYGHQGGGTVLTLG